MRWTSLLLLGLFNCGFWIADCGLGMAAYPQSAIRNPQSPEPDTTALDEKTLRDVGLKVDGPALLDYFRQRTFPETNPKQVAQLLRQLGDDRFPVREKAFASLLNIGSGALVALRQAASDPDAEISRRAHELWQRIEAKAEPAIQVATARLIGRGQPPGAAEVLLNYLPFAADLGVVEEVSRALAKVAVRDGKPEPMIVDSLQDKLPVKRGAAAEALTRARIKDLQPAVRQLLKDAEPMVRLRTAMALLELKEVEVLPVLVDLLGVLGPEQLWPVEEVLVRLAGDKAPTVSLGSDEAARKACRQAWSDWLQKQGKIDLALLDHPLKMLGYTLIVQQTHNRIVGGRVMPPRGLVMELDMANNKRWSFEVQTYPVDAQIVGPDRVLIAEYQGLRVSERDFQGEVKWQKQVNGNPIGCQRLANGNTFIVLQNALLEVDRQGNEVFNYPRPNHDIFRGRKLRNGDLVFITNTGQFTFIDGQTRKEKKSFHVGNIGNLFGSIEVLPAGGVLVPLFQENRVVEFDAGGRQKGQIPMPLPNSVVRLANGHTLVASLNTRRVVEFNAQGREVWSYQAEGMVFNARRR